MNPVQQLMTENIGLWTGADTAKKSGRGRASGSVGTVHGIKKLRELILELAVRGKLVSQDPRDEPASALLERIRAEKARLVLDGKIKKDKPVVAISDNEKPFDLPHGWEWVRLSEITSIRGGATPSMAKSEYWDGDIPWVSPKDMHDGTIVDSELKITEKALRETGLEIVPIGSILIVGRSGILKRKLPAQITAVPCTVNQDIKAVTPIKPLNERYMQLIFWGNEREILVRDVKQGTTVQSLIYESLFFRPFSFPPGAEQQRIVAKVDELMALCDRLEAGHTDATDAHEKLVSHLLATLTGSQDGIDFSVNWQRIAAHFDMLFTTEASIDALKQALLQLAVMGKLVPQDPSDEAASALLERIRIEKARLVLDGKIRKDKPVAAITDDEKLFALPQGWEWARFSDYATDIATGPFGSMIHRTDYVEGGVPLINPSHMIDDRISPDFAVSVSKAMAKILDSYVLCDGDIVMARRGEVGRIALVTPHEDGWLCGTGSFVLRFCDEIFRDYLRVFFRCNSARVYLAGEAVGTTMVNLNHGILKKMPIGVPPIAEQHRIVAKVDELMALCDQMKARIADAGTLQRKLADVMVAQAVA